MLADVIDLIVYILLITCFIFEASVALMFMQWEAGT